ncbi:hypothetical protein VNO77_12842 [Canavalia gladiata]|uniref:Uncharacterized protein n=1 Tax=Canavalia gladiata TaxID=3824 RepID=A0AAN9QN15_CANGL
MEGYREYNNQSPLSSCYYFLFYFSVKNTIGFTNPLLNFVLWHGHGQEIEFVGGFPMTEAQIGYKKNLPLSFTVDENRIILNGRSPISRILAGNRTETKFRTQRLRNGSESGSDQVSMHFPPKIVIGLMELRLLSPISLITNEDQYMFCYKAIVDKLEDLISQHNSNKSRRCLAKGCCPLHEGEGLSDLPNVRLTLDSLGEDLRTFLVRFMQFTSCSTSSEHSKERVCVCVCLCLCAFVCERKTSLTQLLSVLLSDPFGFEPHCYLSLFLPHPSLSLSQNVTFPTSHRSLLLIW